MRMNSMEFAINMEKENKRFYLEQAERVDNSGLKSIFHTLAEEESIHARILKNKMESVPYELNDTFAEIKNIFVGIGQYQGAVKKIPDAFDAYTLALDNEKKSIELYEKMTQETDDENEKKVFHYLIKQEKGHCKVLEQLLELVTNANEWVESAEFGLRTEY